jgi:hypothetical protein
MKKRQGSPFVSSAGAWTLRAVLGMGSVGTIACNGELLSGDTLPGHGQPPATQDSGVSATSNNQEAPAQPGGLVGTFNEDCPAGVDWIPGDGGPPPPVRMFVPPPHPDTECPFYRGAYQTFLAVTTPLPNGDPALVNYATIADAFTSSYNTNHTRNTGDPSADPYENPGGAAAAAMVRQGPATGKAWLGAVHQAGQRQLLIDRDGHTLYYGLHMNEAFVDFIKANNLQTQDGIIDSVSTNPHLSFPPGVAEFKTAWKDIDPRDFPDANGNLGTSNGVVPPPTDFASDPGDYSNYITTVAWIPWLSKDPGTGLIVEDPEHPVQRRVALVAIHCVYTLPGHPEFVWGSVQHVNIHEVDPAPLTYAGVSIFGMPDTQPNGTSVDGGAAILPSTSSPSTNPLDIMAAPDSNHSYLLYQKGTPENLANLPLLDTALPFDEPSQSFKNPDGGALMSVVRLYPGSKSSDLSPDTAVFSLNFNINAMFASAIDAGALDPTIDKRQNYRLVAAVWMDKPDLFTLGPGGQGTSFQNDEAMSVNGRVVPIQPLVAAANDSPPDPVASISQGVTCGTPLGPDGVSGDAPNATGFNNTVPGCLTRADLLALPGSPRPQNPPDDPFSDFTTGAQGTDSPFSILGGEDRLSSTSMETFTQDNTFHNCFTCHNTQPINSQGVSQSITCVSTTPGTPGYPGQPALPGCAATTIPYAAKINVSHMFSEFIVGEQEAAARHSDGIADAGAETSGP